MVIGSKGFSCLFGDFITVHTGANQFIWMVYYVLK